MSKKTIAALLLATPLLCLLFFSFNPAESNYFPKCIFYQLTGIKCPGCGLQRAIHQLLHFNILEAIRYNYFLVLIVPVLIFHGAALVLKDKFKLGQKVLSSSAYPITLAIMVIAWVVFRNLFDW